MHILHTADWHLGQLFHGYDRAYEHQKFLDWLAQRLLEEKVDVLLISGDVFDLSNPSAKTIRQLYVFLNRVSQVCPDIQIIITAGNHDSASRLEAPKPLLESSNIHIIGTIAKDEHGGVDAKQFIIPMYKDGEVKAWCMAIPFLRMGDYPSIADAENPYVAGVTALYQQVYEVAKQKQQPGQAIIAMGHLHASGAEVTDLDRSERPIMGGVECISASAFPDDVAYVALGHIHKAQRLGGQEHIRYSGSPLPMSFSEIHYKHQVVLLSLDGDQLTSTRQIEVPLIVPLLKVPRIHSRLDDVLRALQELPDSEGNDRSSAPFLQVSVLLDGPEPSLRYQVEQVIAHKYVRLARIDIQYPVQERSRVQEQLLSADQLQTLKPVDVFTDVYEGKYGGGVPEELGVLFQEVVQQVYEQEGDEE